MLSERAHTHTHARRRKKKNVQRSLFFLSFFLFLDRMADGGDKETAPDAKRVMFEGSSAEHASSAGAEHASSAGAEHASSADGEQASSADKLELALRKLQGLLGSQSKFGKACEFLAKSLDALTPDNAPLFLEVGA
jgi:hypothetical protein